MPAMAQGSDDDDTHINIIRKADIYKLETYGNRAKYCLRQKIKFKGSTRLENKLNFIFFKSKIPLSCRLTIIFKNKLLAF